jgi:predicted amidophosphoribosyltransferase
MLAEVLSKKTGVRLETGVLFRVHPVHTQVTLSRQKRFNNIEGAFTVKNREKVLGQHILLVDDVFTTGATFNECGKVLLNAGAKEVWVFSLTRGVLQK